MLIKIVVLLITLTLSACFDSQFEKDQDKHIKAFEAEFKNIMLNYSSKAKSAITIDAILQHHQNALDHFNQTKEDLSKYKNETKLNTIVSLYEYAFTYSIQKQIQLIEVASPAWNRNITALEKIKSFSYYQQHQQFLKGLISRINENEKLISKSHENVRKMLVLSGLHEDERRRLWPLLNDLTIKHTSSLVILMHPIQTRIESEIEISTFLYRNRNDFVVTKAKGLEFLSFEMLDSYKRKVEAMNKRYNQDRVISKRVNRYQLIQANK